MSQSPVAGARYAVVVAEPRVVPRQLISELVGYRYVTLERTFDEDLDSLLRSLSPRVLILGFQAASPDATSLIEQFASYGPTVLAVLVRGRATPAATIACIEAGADLFYTAAERPETIVASIDALERRLSGQEAAASSEDEPDVLDIGDLSIDRRRFVVRRLGERVPLTPMEYRVFEYLAERIDSVCDAEGIVQHLYGNAAAHAPSLDMVKTYVKRIRDKLENDPARPEWLVTVRGFGYMLRSDTPG